jgi:hypothetical protein
MRKVPSISGYVDQDEMRNFRTSSFRKYSSMYQAIRIKNCSNTLTLKFKLKKNIWLRCVLDQTGDIVCRNKKRYNCVKYHFTKTYTISDIESMNGGLFDRAMKCKLCRNIDKLSPNTRIALFFFNDENYLKK